MMKNFILTLLAFLFSYGVFAQNKMEEYTLSKNGMTVSFGDTIAFTGGSLGGQYVNVFFMVGGLTKRKATFSDGFYSELIIDHFLERKEDGEEKIFAVLSIPNKPKWFVWVRLEDALKANEVSVKNEN